MNRIGLLFTFLTASVLTLTGCSTRPRSEPPQVSIHGGGLEGVQLTQAGDAKKAATVQTQTETRTVPLPSGTDIVFDEKMGTVTLRLSKDTTLRTETRLERAEGPQAFTPPAPPTPQDEAKGKADLWSLLGYRIGLVLGMSATVFGLVRGWDFVMAGGAAVAGGCAVALFVQQHPLLLVVIGLGVALAFAGPWFWHRHLKHITPAT